MEIESIIKLEGNIYSAQIGIKNLTPREVEALKQFGPKEVEVGGTISGSVSRPGDSAPTVQVKSGTSGGGINATFTPVIVDGVITEITVTNTGQGYSGTPVIEAIGGSHGSGFSAQAVLQTVSPFGIASVTILNGGSNYRTNPTPVTIELPEETRTLDWDFPVKKLFSRDDYFNADLMAQLYKTTIESRLQAARDSALNEGSNFLGTTITTV